MQHQSAPSPTSLAALDAATWRKSTRTQGDQEDCVEIARIPGIIGVRDSKDRQGPKLVFAPTAVRQLVDQIKRGGYDL
jgi:Domain of unknown function (DUF397)